MSFDLLPGTEVIARFLHWEVVSTQQLGQQTLVRLRGLDGVALGLETDLLWPFESIEPRTIALQPNKAAPFKNWKVYHEAFILEQALGPSSLLSVQPGRLRIEPYQLVPVLRAIRMSRPRLLLADGVGLGKTIQAGMILTELIARRIAHRILVVSPAGPLLDQWKTELLDRFGLRAEVIDREYLDDIRKSTELGANPFDFVSVGLSSMDFLKQEPIMELLDRASYDIIVIDEAHHYSDIGAAADREDSLRRKLGELLARRCDCLLLLTATPHDGNDRSLASLCELLDYSLVNGKGELRGERYQPFVVRRLKKHIKNPETRKPLFTEREVIPIPVICEGKEYESYRLMQKRLMEIVVPEFRRALRNRQYDSVLSLISLLKRSVSSIVACHSTLRVVYGRFEQLMGQQAENQESKKQRVKTLRDYNRKLGRFGVISQEEERERETLEAEDIAQTLSVLERELRSNTRQQKKAEGFRASLGELLHLAEATAGHDPKFKRIIDEIRAIRSAEPKANVLIYTEYVTSQKALVKYLDSSGLGTVIAMSGEDGDKDRSIKTNQFRNNDTTILVSTDAAAEGLNLHQKCHHLIHLELPFNPNRLEQRNGRIDRYGQTQIPFVRYLYLSNTFEERILLRLIAKYERQRSKLTFVPNTLGNITSAEAATMHLVQGLVEEEHTLFAEDGQGHFRFDQTPETEGAGKATKELLEEIDRSLAGFERAAKSNNWLGDVGLHAEDGQVKDADGAISRGRKEGMIDLHRFVLDAIYLDGGSVEGDIEGKFFKVIVPASWSQGLKDYPGFDSQTRTLYLSKQLDITQTDEKTPVGFLGRAHPLVRMSLDRVRHLSYGGQTGQALDIRVSAIAVNDTEPSLLFTYLGKVLSDEGREFERVLTVRYAAPNKYTFYSDAAEWLAVAHSGEAISTAGIWEKHFNDQSMSNAALAKASEGFRSIARSFTDAHMAELEKEKQEIERWLADRAREITGTETPAKQEDIFTPGTKAGPAPIWRSLTDPKDRLASFASDKEQRAAARSEANTVIKLYGERLAALQARMNLKEPEVVPLGLLMMVPKARLGLAGGH